MIERGVRLGLPLAPSRRLHFISFCLLHVYTTSTERIERSVEAGKIGDGGGRWRTLLSPLPGACSAWHSCKLSPGVAY